MVGVNVYNEGQRKIGDINDVILERWARCNVILGVGGFLGHRRALCRCRLRQAEMVERAAASTNCKHRDVQPSNRTATNIDSNAAHSGRTVPRARREQRQRRKSEGRWLLVFRPRHLQRDQGPVEGNAAVQRYLKKKPAASEMFVSSRRLADMPRTAFTPAAAVNNDMKSVRKGIGHDYQKS